MVARDEDVRRLDVAVHEPRGVRGVERVGDLGDHARGARGVEPALAPEDPVQVRARHVAHDEVEVAVLLAGRVDRDDVRMVDRRGEAGLALEALPQLGVRRAVGGDELERDRAAEPQLGRTVDHAHAAGAEDLLDAAARELGSG